MRRSIGVAALLIAAIVAWRASRAPSPPPGSPPPGEPTAAGPPPGQVAVAHAVPPPPVLSPVITPYPERGVAGISSDDPLTAYRKANIYPPTSRPLSSDQLDLLRPDQRHETMRPADHGNGVSYLFTADRYFVIGDQTLTSTLEVRRDGKPQAVAITRAFAAVIGAPGAPPTPLTFTAAGARFTHSFAPAQLGLARQSGLTMYIEFDDGIARQRAQFDVQYTPTGGIPARFTGALRDAVDDGSLVIHAAVDVTTPGRYIIDANLFDAADHPVAWSRFKGELAAGTHDAALVFFGKVLRDAGARGPFHIGQLRGARFAPDLDPDLEQMPPFAGSFTTRPYPADAFSDAEYDSPDKRRMIDLLRAGPTHRGAAPR